MVQEQASLSTKFSTANIEIIWYDVKSQSRLWKFLRRDCTGKYLVNVLYYLELP